MTNRHLKNDLPLLCFQAVVQRLFLLYASAHAKIACQKESNEKDKKKEKQCKSQTS